VGFGIKTYLPLRTLIENTEWIVSTLRARNASHPTKWSLLWAWLWAETSIDDAVSEFRSAATCGEADITRDVQLSLWPSDGYKAVDACVNRVADALSRGDSMADTCSRIGCKMSDLARWLRIFPKLRRSWSDSVMQQRHATAVNRLEAEIQQTPGLDRKQLYARCKADVVWLERHDPTMAARILEQVPSERSTQRLLFSR
jgi:transposase-like protein